VSEPLDFGEPLPPRKAEPLGFGESLPGAEPLDFGEPLPPLGPSLLDRLGEAVPLIPALRDAYAAKEAALAPAVPAYVAVKRAEALRLADEAELRRKDEGLLGGNLEKGGLYDRAVEATSREFGQFLGAGGEPSTADKLMPETPAEKYKRTQAMLRSGSMPAQLEEQLKEAHDKDALRLRWRIDADRAYRAGAINNEERDAARAGVAPPIVLAKIEQHKGPSTIGEWAEDFNPVRSAIHALGAGGRAIEKVATGGRGYAQASRDAMEKLRNDPGSMTHDDAIFAGLPLVGRFLFGQDGEDAGVVANDLVFSTVLDPINIVGGPALTAGGRVARGIHRMKLGQAANLGIDMTEDMARYEATAAKLGTSPDLAVTMADQVVARQRTAATLAGVPIERLVPVVGPAASKALHQGLGWTGDMAKRALGPERAKRLAYDYRFTSLLTPAEQNRLLMDYLKSKQTRHMAAQIKTRFEADGKGLKAARSRFDRATGNAEVAQRRAMLDIFEDGPANELRARVYDGISTKAISRDEGAFLLRAQRRADQMLKAEERAGVQGIAAGVKGVIQRLDESEITYLHHAQTQEWRDAAAKVYKDKTPSEINDILMPSLKGLMTPGHGRERAWNMPVREANFKARGLLEDEARRRGVEIDLSEIRLFHDDVNLIMAARHIKSIKAIHAAELVKGYAEVFSVPAATLGKKFGSLSVLELREAAKVKLEFAQAYRDVWAAVAKDPARFAGGVADEATAARMLAKTKRLSDKALREAKTAEDFAAIRAELDAIAGGPGMYFPEEEFAARRRHARALAKGEAAAVEGIEAAGRAAEVYAEVAPLAGTAPGATRALREARVGFRGKTAPDVLPGSLDRLRGATDDLATLHGLKSDWKVFDDDALPWLKGRALPPEIAEIVDKARVAEATKPGWVAAAWDFHQQWWKAWSLGPRPSFHTRNYASGKLATWYEDALHPVSEYLSKLFMSPVDSSRATFTLGGKRVGLHAEHEAFEQLGGRGVRYTESIQQMADGLEAKLAGDERWQALAAGKVGKTPLERAGRTIQAYVPLTTMTTSKSLALRAGAFTGNLVEHDLRFSHYLGRRLKGDSQIDAILSVKRAHFDYGEVTATERKGLGRVFTFYNYLRNNAEFQLGNLLTKPGKIARKEHAIDVLSGKGDQSEYGGIPEELFPEYMRKAGLAKVGKVINGRVHAYTRSGFDTTWDLNRFGDVDDGIMGSMATPIQLALGLATGRDTYSERSLRGLETNAPGGYGSSREFFGNRVHPITAFTGEKLLPAGPLEAHRLGVFGGKAAQPLYGIKGEPVSWRIPLPFHERADEPDRPQPPVGERIARYLIGMRPYEVELWKEGRRRYYADHAESKESQRKAARETSTQDQQRLLLQALEYRARSEKTVADYAKAGIKLEAPSDPLPGYQ
jgi:hypothetical protein